MVGEIVGREQELKAVTAFLDDVSSGTRGLLVAGPPGIGKTAILQAALSSIGEREYRVLSSIPVEAEARLSYAALGDLIGDALDDVADVLPLPQRHAIDVALLRAESGGQGADRRGVAMAAFHALQAMARVQPLVVAIDDVQWIDAPSAQALSFALRRLDQEPVGVLATVREAPGLMDPLSLESAFGVRTTRMAVGPLSIRALAAMVRRASGRDISRPLLVRVHEVSRGNPLFALEIVRAMHLEGGKPEPGEPLPVPEDLGTLLRARIEVLAAREQEALLVASSMSRPTVALVQAALGRSGEDVLGRAESAGIVRVHRDRVMFSHPLLASAVYQGASSEWRRRTHLRLAKVVRDDEEQARHIALGSAGPDADDATALEEAAKHAYVRGAPDAAAELWELSRRATPVEDAEGHRRRGTQASACAFDAGDVAGARLIADQVLSVSPPGEARADIFDMVSSFAWYDVIEIRSLLKSGIEEAPDPSGALAAMTADLGWVEIVGGDLRDASKHARRAIEIGERSGDQGAVMVALIAAGHTEFMLGRDPTGLLERAIALERGNPKFTYFHANPRNTLGATLMWAGDLAGARRLLEQYYKETTDQGRYTALGDVLVHLAELESRAGDYRRALAYADELLEMTAEAGYEGMRELGLWARALAEAHLGDVERARRDATEGQAVAQRHGDLLHVITNRSVLGFVEVSLGDLDLADTFLEPLPGLIHSRGIVEPGIYPFVPDAVEALTGTGRIDRAREVLEPYERLGHELDRPLVIATAARCRGLLAAANGELDEAIAVLELAIDAHDRVQQPFELARTLLVVGEVRRRAKQKRPAREALDRAADIFDDLGTRIWSTRARASVARISGRSASANELTETERQVARLAAQGKTNREVAEAMFLSQKTVEANLSRAYRKLGIRSRRQLGDRLVSP